MTYGFKQSHFNYANRWKADCDYMHKLSPEEKEYLVRFLKEFYEGKKFSDFNLIQDKRESYNRNNAANRCAMIKYRKSGEEIETMSTTSKFNEDIIFKKAGNE